MGDVFKKVKGGDPIRIPAPTYNAFIDAARYVKDRAHDQRPSPRPGSSPSSAVVRVKNTSGGARGRFHVLGVDSALIAPTVDLDSFKDQVALKGIAPDAGAHAGRFVVLLEPLDVNAIGRAVVDGAVQVRVNVVNESHIWAEVENGNATRLVSAESGSARILWKESGTGEKWAIVRLQGGGSGGMSQLKVQFRFLQDMSKSETETSVVVIDTFGGDPGPINEAQIILVRNAYGMFKGEMNLLGRAEHRGTFYENGYPRLEIYLAECEQDVVASVAPTTVIEPPALPPVGAIA